MSVRRAGSYLVFSTASAGDGNPYFTGGTVTEAGGYRIHSFTNQGSGELVMASSGSNVDILIVAGGGSGGSGTGGYAGGAGGAGGYRYLTSQSLTSSVSLNVGRGGVGAATGAINGQPGYDTNFGNTSCIGGGRGGKGATTGNAGTSGGSGGGGGGGGNNPAAGNGTEGQGNAGGPGSSGGGGGGGGGAATAGRTNYGGDGLANTVSGANVTYAVGGTRNENSNGGSAGAANTGSGGNGSISGGTGGDGQVGIIVVRYPLSK